MADTASPESFEEIVEWAYSTLPQKIRDLPDFPGIQVVDEPPADVLEDISNRKKWRRRTELLGLYSGTFRTKRSYTQVKYAPDLIFVFRGSILRCSRGDLRAEVKRVVWHEVAHWLGYETEEQVKGLGFMSHHQLVTRYWILAISTNYGCECNGDITTVVPPGELRREGPSLPSGVVFV